MKITLNLTAGIELNDVEIKGISESEAQKNWNSKNSSGRQRETRASVESLGGSAKCKFDMQINFDLEPEELKECHSYIKELTKTVADSHSKTAEAVKETAEAVEKTADLSSKTATFEHPNPDIKKKVDCFMKEAREARDTNDFGIANHALLVGHIAIRALKKDGKEKNAGTIADIEGIMNTSLMKIINDVDDDHII